MRELAWALKHPKVAQYFANLKDERRPNSGWIAPLWKQGLLSLADGRTDDGRDIGGSLVSNTLDDHRVLHPVTQHLGRWISRCLDSQEAIDWVLLAGAVLHVDFRYQVRLALSRDNKQNLTPAVRKLWRVLSELGYAHALSEKNRSNDFQNMSEQYVESAVPYTMRMFLDRLRPIPIFSGKLNFFRPDSDPDPEHPSDWYETKIELVGIRGDYEVKEIRRRSDDWTGALAVMAESLTTRLCEAMDWYREFGLASSDVDNTHIVYRSISPHEQNKHAPTWTQLIALARDSRNALLECGEHAAASRLERRWQTIPYPVFQRLALYAATEPAEANIELGMEVLLDAKRPALWNLYVFAGGIAIFQKARSGP